MAIDGSSFNQNKLMNGSLQDVLLKDYQEMRTEIRLYVNKFYLLMSAVFAILSAGIFKTKPDEGSIIFVLTPYIVAGLIGFISMVTFYVNKIAGYVKCIEFRLSKIYGADMPRDPSDTLKSSTPLAPIFWESFYADTGMNRNSGKQLGSLHGVAFVAMCVPASILLSFIIYMGAASIQSVALRVLYVISSVVVLTASGYVFWLINTKTRAIVQILNGQLFSKYTSD